MTPNAAQAKGTTSGPVVTIQDVTGWFDGPWFDSSSTAKGHFSRLLRRNYLK
jgi:hypothetical protein